MLCATCVIWYASSMQLADCLIAHTMLPNASAHGLSGDPFTRLLRPGRQAAAFQDTTEGQIKAIGLQLASAPENRLQVGLVLNDSPAHSAGVQPGDEILEINGLNVQSKSKK
jgi:C-terminal processing protease CtpA/Prc